MIAAIPGAVERVAEDMFLVKSQSGGGSYRVSYAGEGAKCDCPDFVKRGLPCKHALSVRFYLEKQTTNTAGETMSVRIPITHPQAWASYDRAQMEEIRLFDILLADLVSSVPEPARDPHGAGRPPMAISHQLFCTVQKVYSQMSCRRAWGLFENAVEKGLLPKAPHFGTSSAVMNRPEVTEFLHTLIARSALPLAALENGFAPDSSGFQTTSFGAWREEKHGEKRERFWLKVHVLAGVKTHVIARVVVTGKDGADCPQFEPMIRSADEGGLTVKEVYADKAYSSRDNFDLAGELGFGLYVPFKSNTTGKSGGSPLWRKAFLFFQMHRDEFDEKYHARSNVESVFSALKRKFGETLRSKTRVAQENELLAKVLAYNLTVLIHEIFEHGVVPDFLLGSDAGRRATGRVIDAKVS